MRTLVATVLVCVTVPAAAGSTAVVTAGLSASTRRTGAASSPFCYYSCAEHGDTSVGLNLEAGLRPFPLLSLTLRSSIFYYAPDANGYVRNLDVPLLATLRLFPWWKPGIEPYVAFSGGVGVRRSWNRYDDVGITELAESAGESATVVAPAFALALGVTAPLDEGFALDVRGELLCMDAHIPAHNLGFNLHVGLSFEL